MTGANTHISLVRKRRFRESAAGVPFTTVVELLGHAPQGVTWGTCTHRVDGWDRQVRNVLETAWREDSAD